MPTYDDLVELAEICLRQAHAAKSRAVAAELRCMAKEYQKRAAELTRGRTDCGNLALGLGRGGVARPAP